MNSRPFRLMIVAEDRKTLRRMTRFLSAFGFDVDPVTDVRQAISACKASPPDFLIVDGDSLNMEQCRQLFSKNRKGYSYTFLMLRDAQIEGLDRCHGGRCRTISWPSRWYSANCWPGSVPAPGSSSTSGVSASSPRSNTRPAC